MEIDKSLIKHVAELARINLTEDEVEEFTPQLREVFKHCEKISEIDTRDIEPSFQPIKIRDSLRDDIIEDSLSQKEALRNTKHKKDGYFRGPAAL
ncbi:MAG: Asp-tRNA(Asn)/Glu-tRNA(Gln) amidotransferase subunit GatC [Nanobdellota archaeon]